MKKWIIKLLSDNNGNPSVRLHLAIGCFLLLCYSVYVNKPEYIITSVSIAMAGMCGISVFDKGKKDETNKEI